MPTEDASSSTHVAALRNESGSRAVAIIRGMTYSDLSTLLDYHYWARDRVLDAVEPLSPEQFTRDLGSSFRSVRDTLAHLYGSEWAWHSRWIGTSPTALPDPGLFADVAAIRASWSILEGKVRGFLASLGEHGIDREFEYRNLAGQPARSSFREMMQHMVNHGSYHRGQVTTLLRQLGAPPARSMDLIRFLRDRGH
jgi:uncharacterized damage-inducible protein DinB